MNETEQKTMLQMEEPAAEQPAEDLAEPRGSQKTQREAQGVGCCGGNK